MEKDNEEGIAEQIKEESNNVTDKEININGNNSVSVQVIKEEDKFMTSLPFWPYIGKTASLLFPGMFFYMVLLLLQTINLIFIGQKYNNVDMINAIGVTNLYMNCTLMSIYMGLVSGIEILCANAYSLKKYKLMGYYYQRARIIGYAATIVIVLIHVFSFKHILRLFKLTDAVIEYSFNYSFSCLIYVFFDVQTACIFRFLNVINKPHINFIILLISLIFHPLWNWVFISYLDYDVIGAGISFVISKLIAFLLSIGYFWYYDPLPEANFWINANCFKWKGIVNYLKCSLGSAFLLCAEWWGFEIQAIIAISISEEVYTVHVLCAEICGLLYSFSVGCMIAISVNISELITHSNVSVIKKACIYAVTFGMLCDLVIQLFYFIFKRPLLDLFIEDETVSKLGYPVLPYVGYVHFFDLFQTCLVSVYRGIGKHYLASCYLFLHYYILMTTCSWLLGSYYELGCLGMWYGILLSDFIACLLYLISLICINFPRAQRDTIKRINGDLDLMKQMEQEERLEGNADFLPNNSTDGNNTNHMVQLPIIENAPGDDDNNNNSLC